MSKEQGSESAVSGSQSIKEEEMAEEKEAPKRVSRRQFVKGAAVGGAGVAAAGMLASCAPAPVPTTAPGETAAPAPTCPAAAECPPAETPWLPENWDEEADVVIVGYGGAGACAAIAAADAGVTPLVLEKSPTAEGGNTGVCGGAMAVPEDLAAGIEYYKSVLWGTVDDEELIEACVEGVMAMPDWLRELGADIEMISWPGLYHTWFPSLPGAISPDYPIKGFYVPMVEGAQGAGSDMHRFLRGLVEDRNIKVMLGTPGKELIQDPATKEILGVKAIDAAENEIYIKARRGVVLACGGFEYDQDMIHQFCKMTSHSLFCPTMGTPYNTGDGIYMATAAGAKLWHMNEAEICSPCAKVPSEIYGAGLTMSAVAESIWVNPRGKRFMNEKMFWSHTKETAPLYHFTNLIDLVEYPNIPFYMIFDDTLMKKGPLHKAGKYFYLDVHKLYEWSEDNQAELAEGWIIKGDTIEELGSKIECKDFFGRVVGMDAAGLAETVKKYNEYCAAGEDPEFGTPSAKLVPIQTPPFYALEMTVGNINTMGGPVHNKYSQTLDFDGNPIARLYSCGELGSIFGFLYQGASNFPECLSSGKTAAEHAAGLEPWDA